MKKTLSLVLLATMTMGVIAGCGNNAENTSTSNNNSNNNSSSNTENNKDDDDNSESASNEPIVYRTTGDKASTLNPHQYTLTSESGTMSYIYGNLIETVVNEAGDAMEFIPNFATKLPEMSEDGLTWTFEIRDDIEWNDGTAITPETFEYSYKMLLDPVLLNYRAFTLFDNSVKIANAEKYYLGECEWEEVGVKVDGNKLVITLETPAPELDFLIAFSGGGVTSPVHPELYESCFNEDKTENSYGTSLETTASSGPYILTDWVRDQLRVYTRNEKSHLAETYYTPDEINVRIVADATTRLSLFESNETDYIGVSGENYSKYEEDPRIVFSEGSSVTTLNINTNSETVPVLGNLDFRKALFYAMDRELIANELYKTALPAPYFNAYGRFANIDLRYRDVPEAKALVPENNGFNPELAKEHFDKAFEANGGEKISVELKYFDTNESMKKMGEFLEEEYEKLFGADRFDIELRAIPWQSAYDDLETGNYELSFCAMSGWSLSPYNFMGIYTSDTSQKNCEFANEEYDALYDKMMSAELILNEPERLKVLAQLEAILYEEMPIIPTIETRGASMYSDRLILKTGGTYLPVVGFGVLQSEFVDGGQGQ